MIPLVFVQITLSRYTMPSSLLPHLKQHHLLTKAFLFASIAIVIITLLIAVLNYQNHVRLRMVGYEEILNVLESTYIYELVKENEKQHSVLISMLDQSAILAGESVFNPVWAVGHKIKMEEEHYIYFYNALNGHIDSYPHWERSADFNPETRPWFHILKSESNAPVWIGPYEEFNSHQKVLSLGQKVLSDSGLPIGVMLVDMSLDTLDKVLERMSTNLNISVFIRDRQSQEMLSVVNGELLQFDTVSANQSVVCVSGLLDGILLVKPLAYVDWEVGIYVPAVRFQKALVEQLVLLLLPIAAFFIVAAMGTRSLMKVFRQELKLIELEVEQLNGVLSEDKLVNSSWFVDKSLRKIKNKLATQHLKLRLDPLTNIGNRRAFDEDLNQFGMHQPPYVLVLIDVDFFKQINDQFGHQFGDSVLRRVADILAVTFTRGQVYRFGGDEFACLLPLEDKAELVNNLNRLLDTIRLQQWREKQCRVTLSIGIAIGPKLPQKLFESADAALYRSKAAGRDCWHLG